MPQVIYFLLLAVQHSVRCKTTYLAGGSLFGADRMVRLQWRRVGHWCVQGSVVGRGCLLELRELRCHQGLGWCAQGGELYRSLGWCSQGSVLGALG